METRSLLYMITDSTHRRSCNEACSNSSIHYFCSIPAALYKTDTLTHSVFLLLVTQTNFKWLQPQLKFSSCDAIKRKQKRNNWCESRFGGNGDADASSDRREVIISFRAVEDFSPGWTDSPHECLQHVNELDVNTAPRSSSIRSPLSRRAAPDNYC